MRKRIKTVIWLKFLIYLILLVNGMHQSKVTLYIKFKLFINIFDDSTSCHQHKLPAFGYSVSLVAALGLVSGVSALSLRDALLGSLSTVSLNLVGGTVVQFFEWLVSDLVHSEGAVSSVVARSVRCVEVTRLHSVTSSWWWSSSSSWASSAWWVPSGVAWWWSSWSVPAVHWRWASLEIAVVVLE